MHKKTKEDLNLNNGWRIGEDSFTAVVKLFSSISPKVIVEFGAGASSIRLAQEFPDAEIISIDHDQEYIKESINLQQEYSVENLKILYRPIRWQIHGGGIFQCYVQEELPASIDAVIIDGPPYFVHLGREACFHQIVQKVSNTGIVVLDDCNRTSERRAVANWLESYPESFDRNNILVGHGLCALVKKGEAKYRVKWRVLGLNYRSFAGLLKRCLLEKLSSH
ncbi:MAG TPA: hypothetical protein ENH49_05925 [Candidatus Marinimicrobia bacterium]|nr:hypothetical protein [Candidatus Neomarinimicrobiota bacterium]